MNSSIHSLLLMFFHLSEFEAYHKAEKLRSFIQYEHVVTSLVKRRYCGGENVIEKCKIKCIKSIGKKVENEQINF